ncbi:hypothetical protein [Parafrankia discariae]|uniref:hypothetical protein n=1 Tax=Parafrankia discariae TaxID=365528 RepID=UPI0003609872|nr:hypothetical protein [Parafrankia discariae]
MNQPAAHQPAAHQRADHETPAAEQTPPPPQPFEDREPLGVVMAVELNTGDLYRHTDPVQRARDRARHGSDLWIVTIPFDTDALDRDEDPDLHACPARHPHRSEPQYFLTCDEDVDRVAVLHHETFGYVARGYKLLRVYRLPQHTVRVRVFRIYDHHEDHQHTSSATVDILTPAGWSPLLTEPAERWRPEGRTSITDETTFTPVAARLIADACRILAPQTPPPAPFPPAGNGNPPLLSGGDDSAGRRPRARTSRFPIWRRRPGK